MASKAFPSPRMAPEASSLPKAPPNCTPRRRSHNLALPSPSTVNRKLRALSVCSSMTGPASSRVILRRGRMTVRTDLMTGRVRFRMECRNLPNPWASAAGGMHAVTTQRQNIPMTAREQEQCLSAVIWRFISLGVRRLISIRSGRNAFFSRIILRRFFDKTSVVMGRSSSGANGSDNRFCEFPDGISQFTRPLGIRNQGNVLNYDPKTENSNEHGKGGATFNGCFLKFHVISHHLMTYFGPNRVKRFCIVASQHSNQNHGH